MRVIASAEAVALVQKRGGKVYVLARSSRCCGGTLTFLETAGEPSDHAFNRFDADGIEVYVDERLQRPDEIELALGGLRRRRLRAYPNGCAYVV